MENHRVKAGEQGPAGKDGEQGPAGKDGSNGVDGGPMNGKMDHGVRTRSSNVKDGEQARW
jgi:hypothetical protein